MKRFKHVLTILLMAFAASPVIYSTTSAFAEPVIVIGNPNVKPMPIAIPDFAGAAANGNQVGVDIAKVVSDELQRSGLVAPIAHQAFIQDNVSLQQGPRFQDWRLLKAQALCSRARQGQAKGRGQGEIRPW